MSLLARAAFGLCLIAALAAPLQARDELPETTPAQLSGLVAFASDEGMARLTRATAKADFAALANQFEAQSNAAFCGPTTAAIVLNALHGRSPHLPRDRSRLSADDVSHLPAGADVSLPRFTQDNVIPPGRKTRAQVLGEPIDMDGKPTRDVGYQLRQFDQMLGANGLATRLVIVDATLAEATIRSELASNLARAGDYVIVNYRRELVGQRGGGHISPLAAYDAESDSFLVLDVNPASQGWVWMPTHTLVNGMRSLDAVENRGYVLVQLR